MLPMTAPGAAPAPRRTARTGVDRRLSALVVTALVVVLLARSCRGEEPQRAGHCVIAVDRSGSVVKAPELDDDYRHEVEERLRRCSVDDMDAVVVAITENTHGDLIDPVSVNLVIPSGSEGNRKDARDAKIAAAMEEVDVLLDERTATTGEGTDLLTVASVALRTFDLDDERNRLSILSDAVNTRRPAPLELVPLGLDETPDLVAELQDQGLAPKLPGVEIEMWGEGRGIGAEALPIDRPPLIEDFWTTYWDATGARLVAYR